MRNWNGGNESKQQQKGRKKIWFWANWDMDIKPPVLGRAHSCEMKAAARIGNKLAKQQRRNEGIGFERSRKKSKKIGRQTTGRVRQNDGRENAKQNGLMN